MVQGGREVALLLSAALLTAFAIVLAGAPIALAGEPPRIEITYPDPGATVSGTVTVAGIARDADGEVTKVLVGIDTMEKSLATDTSGNGTWWTWEWVWDTTHFENGWHRVGAIAYDSSGMAADTAVEVFVENPLDEAPIVEIHSPEEGAVVSGIVAITGHARDDGAILFVKVRIDLDGDLYAAEDTSGNGTWWTWALSWDSRTVPNGEHTIYAKAVDAHEHVGWDSVHIKVMNEGGNRAPWVSIFHPPQGSTVRGVIAIMGHAGDEDPDDRVELVQVKIDLGEWQNAVDISDSGNWATWAFEWDTTKVEVGWHHVYARSFDGELYSEKAVLEVFVEHEGGNRFPEVRIDHPVSGDVVQGLVLVHGRAWDPDEGDHVTGVWVRIDEGEWHLAKDLTDHGTWAIWGWVWDTTGYDDGAHRVCAKASDGEVYSELHCIEVRVENPDHRPFVRIDHPENGDEVHGVVLVHGVSEDDRRVEAVQIRIDESEWAPAVDTSQDHTWRTWAFEWDTRRYDNGEHVVSARAWDGHQYSEVHKIVVIVANHEGGFVGLVRENPVPVGVLGFAGTVGLSLALWWRRFGPLGGLR